MVNRNDFVSREELLGGGLPPGRHASALLFAIESRTAHLVSQAQLVTAIYLTQKAIEERESEYLEALASGRQPPLQPRIQDLERYTAGWLDLVSETNPNLKAALAFALGEKYSFSLDLIPNIRTALGFETESVAQAFRRQYHQEISTIYTAVIPARERARWEVSRLASRLETLPPFWIAFALTIPLGSGLLALPIALAGVGPSMGIGLVILFGIISALTTAALAEAVARSEITSFGLGYLGQLVSEYLGSAGSFLLTASVALDSFLCLIIFYLGVAGTLEEASHLPTELWVVVLFVAGIFFLSRKSLSSTVTSTLLIASINLVILVILPLLALPYLVPENFSQQGIQPTDQGSFDFSIVRLVFGVVISNYSSHLCVGNYGRVVLRRDPSARSWIWGCLAAIGVAVIVSILWVLAINGTLPADMLVDEAGTAIPAMATLVGPAATWLGSAFVVLSLGMGCIHFSLSLFFLMDERLPMRSKENPATQNRFVLCSLPVIVAFLAAEWLSITNKGSFAELLGFVGVVTLPLIAGLFPVLLLATTRRKGDIVPSFVLKWLGHPILLVGIYLLFVASIFLHGLFAFQDDLQQAIILLAGCIVVVMTGIMLRQRALTKRTVVALRQDQSMREPVIFYLIANGQTAVSDVRLDYQEETVNLKTDASPISHFTSLYSIRFQLPVTGADEIKVWAHTITPHSTVEALPTGGTIQLGDQIRQLNLSHRDGQRTFVMEHEPCIVELHLKVRKKT